LKTKSNIVGLVYREGIDQRNRSTIGYKETNIMRSLPTQKDLYCHNMKRKKEKEK